MPGENPIEPLEAETAESRGSGLRALLATPGGKIVAVGVGLGVLGVIAGIVAVVFLVVLGKGVVSSVESGVVPVVPARSVSATSATGGSLGTSTGTGKTTEAPGEVLNSEVFTFRDVFRPLITKKAEEDTAGGPGSSETSQTVGDPDTLYLQDIRVEGDVEKAVLTLNGTEYVLAEGEVLGSTPWKVLTIDDSSDTVVMLYGDSQVSLTVGQGTSDDK